MTKSEPIFVNDVAQEEGDPWVYSSNLHADAMLDPFSCSSTIPSPGKILQTGFFKIPGSS